MDGRADHDRIGWLLAGLLCWPFLSGLEASNAAVLEIGNRKQLFLDRHVVESLTHAKKRLTARGESPASIETVPAPAGQGAPREHLGHM